VSRNYITLKLTKRQAKAVQVALECEIVSCIAAAHNSEGERCDVPRGQGAIDDEVPALERALGKIRQACLPDSAASRSR